MNNLLKAALAYRLSGLSVIVISKSKRAIHCWRRYQKFIINKIKLEVLLKRGNASGIAIICGPVSGNLEAIDIDEKNSIGIFLFKEYLTRLDQKSSELISRLVVACTKNKGFHLLYTCCKVERNTVLAKRPCTSDELLKNPDEKTKILIERRGIKSYIVVFPTPGYQFIQYDLQHLPHISEKERDLLANIARSFNLYREIAKQPLLTKPVITTRVGSPFEDFNNRGDIIGLLQKHGWIVVGQDTLRTYFKRPGKTDHESSGDFHHEMGLFTLFTTSTEFIAEKGYKPYAVYAILECNSDFKLAAKKLLAEGYGIPYSQQ